MDQKQKNALYVGAGVAGLATAAGVYQLLSNWTHIHASHLEWSALNNPSADFVQVLLSQKWSTYDTNGGYPEAPNPGSRDVNDYPVTSFAQADAVFQAWYVQAAQGVNNGTIVTTNIPLFSLDNIGGGDPFAKMASTLEAVSESIYDRLQASTLIQFDGPNGMGTPQPGESIPSDFSDFSLSTYSPDDPNGGVMTYGEAQTFWDGFANVAFTIDGQESAPKPTDSTLEYFFTALGSLISNLPATIAAMIAGATQWAAKVVAGALSGAVVGTITGLLAVPIGLLVLAGVGTWFAYKHFGKPEPKALSERRAAR